jgi:D-alanyl-lipoteichoic acid acyltransferase DltB (MBOAT superfamily)
MTCSLGRVCTSDKAFSFTLSERADKSAPVNYTETLFLLIFVLVAFASLALRPWPMLRQWFLTIFSLFIIMTWGVYSLVLFLAIAVANFFVARRLASRSDNGRLILALAIAGDVAALAIFKYSGFLHLNLSRFTSAIGIPLAISFYTFHIISYLVDIYRGKTGSMTFGRYLFYLSFFPHVVAGPIVRTWQLVPQLRLTRHVAADWAVGFHFLVTGFFLKTVCADNVAAIIDPAWSSAALSTPDRWLVALLYYCQIYGDFGGYSLMALGMARLLGFRLPANFRSPMRAASLQEFWRRWHITLSRWLRDYLYIPLGGNRTGNTAMNLLATMVLGGLWHGAAWGFIVWGLMHGIGLAVERALPQARGSVLWWLVTQVWVTTAWIPFRLPDWHLARPFVMHMFWPTGSGTSSSVAFALIFAAPIIIHQFLPLLIPRIGRKALPIYLGVMTAVLLIGDLTIVAPGRVFLYFSF